jgi:hypothetical protein
VYIQTGKIKIFKDDGTKPNKALETWQHVLEFLETLIAPEAFGFENKDALTYFTDKLVELNSKVRNSSHTRCTYVGLTTFGCSTVSSNAVA